MGKNGYRARVRVRDLVAISYVNQYVPKYFATAVALNRLVLNPIA